MPELIVAVIGLVLFGTAFMKVLYDVHSERDLHRAQHTKRIVDETIALYERQFAK
jgi:hypothetical protein